MANDATEKTPKDFSQLYGIFTQLAVHGQENKWWMLYIYLLFNSILVFSCSTILVADTCLLIHCMIVSVFCLAGLVANTLWLLMAADYVRASNLYPNIARDAEAWMPKGLRKPWKERDDQRSSKNPFARLSAASYTLAGIFIVTYVVIVEIAWVRLLHCAF